MEQTTTGSALAAMGAALDGIAHSERVRIAHAERLALVQSVRTILARTEALAGMLVEEADRARSSVVVAGTPTTSWLQASGTASKGEAVGLVLGGRDLAERPGVRDAALSGRVSVRQARAIVKVVGGLPVGLTPAQRAEAEGLLLAEADHTDAEHLARLGPAVLELVEPTAVMTADDEARQLDAQRRRAHAARGLTFADDGDGSWRVSGSLPHLLAAPLIKVIDARVESLRRAQRDSVEAPGGTGARAEREDVPPDRPTPAQRRADALCSLAHDHLMGAGATPRVAGDRPRVVVTMSYDRLREHAEQAGALDSGQPVSAGDLRRLCCDADLVPAVLGGSSELLDYGRTRRLVPSGLRRALGLRDGGCAFPGCDQPDSRCESHHLVPWWSGGETCLANLVLLCPHHHGVVEPLRWWSGPPPDRWQARLDSHGIPEFVPPWSLDPTRTPRRQPPRGVLTSVQAALHRETAPSPPTEPPPGGRIPTTRRDLRRPTGNESVGSPDFGPDNRAESPP